MVGGSTDQRPSLGQNIPVPVVYVYAPSDDPADLSLTPDNVAAYREVRQDYLKPAHLPASTLVGVTALVHPDLLLEVEVVAAVGGSTAKKKSAKKAKALARGCADGCSGLATLKVQSRPRQWPPPQ